MAKNLIWTTVKKIFQIFLTLRFQICFVNSCMFKYPEFDTYDRFCGPGIYAIYVE